MLVGFIVLLLLGAAGEAGAGTPTGRLDVPRTGGEFPDPAVSAYRGGLVAVATGPGAPRMTAAAANAPWHRAGRALVRKPDWASSAGLWGVDLIRIGDRWLLYFAAPVRGLGPEGRCIGVAVSREALGRFTPVGRPLVCPRGARKPGGGLVAPAPDRVRSAWSRLPRRGVIDPSVVRLGRRAFLLYKTQGLPSTIRIVRLTDGGMRATRGSRELIRVRHIVENPVLLRRGGRYVLLTSEGSYADCGYRTVWRRSAHLLRWGSAKPRLLLGRGSGVCGPGGADVVVRHAGPVVFFHGWACGRFAHTCPSRGRLDDRPQLDARRTLYAARLTWRDGRPHLARLPARTHDPDGLTPMIEVTPHHARKHAKQAKKAKKAHHRRRHASRR